MENPAGKNLRRHIRAPIAWEVDCSDGQRFLTGRLCDISEGGLQIETPRSLDPGTKLTLAVSSSPPLKIKGIVRWTRRDGLRHRIGVQFVQVSQEDKTRIKGVVQAYHWQNIAP